MQKPVAEIPLQYKRDYDDTTSRSVNVITSCNCPMVVPFPSGFGFAAGHCWFVVKRLQQQLFATSRRHGHEAQPPPVCSTPLSRCLMGCGTSEQIPQVVLT